MLKNFQPDYENFWFKLQQDKYSAWGEVSAHPLLCSDRHPVKHE